MQTVNSVIGRQPLLTIAIPTYNRAAFLDLCLKRISEELDSLSADQRDLVKVYVSNNASTDNTAEIIAQYQSMKVGEFEAVLNAENIGGERNVEQCYMSAATPYVWVLGDDDVILPSGLDIVLEMLCREDVDILSVGCRPYVERYDEKLKATRRRNKGMYLTRNVIEFTKRTNINLTFISSLIVRSGRCCTQSNEVVRDSNLPQMCWVSCLLCEGKKFAIANDMIVSAKADNSGGFSLVQVFGSNLQRITNSLLREKPKLSKIIQNGAIVNFFPSSVIALRSNKGRYFSEDDLVCSLSDLYRENWRYYIFLMPLLYLPLPLLKIVYVVLRIIRRISRTLLV